VQSVLFIDDEVSLLYMITAYFDALGYDVTAARDPEEAGSLIRDKVYSLVVSDLELCDPAHRRGFDVLRQARKRSPQTRTILLTSYGSPEVRREAAAIGVDLVLDKPQSLKRLADTVAEMLNGREGEAMTMTWQKENRA
jgi:CheY-like chemotaxis protein